MAADAARERRTRAFRCHVVWMTLSILIWRLRRHRLFFRKASQRIGLGAFLLPNRLYVGTQVGYRDDSIPIVLLLNLK